ncbi:MAG: homocysteine biosynthesis protein [Methanocellales archaeon]|nr:homocysteine biosynthesis protein [Methanocellales archaeon]
MVEKTVQEINQKIRDGSVHVVTAEEMTEIVETLGPKGAAKEVDVVTTGTFGAMCSSGAILNFGHADPPIKMQKVWLNDVEAYAGLAAVDAYIGATQLSESRGMEYGGGHVIEDLVAGKSVELRAIAYGTDCYPRRNIETSLTLSDVNQAVMINPRNAYQRYNVATNSSDRILHTYMGPLLPNLGNAIYSGSGALSPLFNDPTYATIGIGTRIFLCGAHGYIIGEGTQHDPTHNLGTLMVQGNLKEMSTDFVRGASLYKYGTTLYVGLSIPIPILNENIAKRTGIKDADISTNVLDYSVPRRSRPTLARVTYEELKSGGIVIGKKEIRTSSLSSLHKAREVAETLRERIKKGEFYLSEPVGKISTKTVFKPMRQTGGLPLVKDVMTDGIGTIKPDVSIEEAAKRIIKGGFNHLPVVSDDGRLVGIVTAWDISKAVAMKKRGKVEQIMTRKVIVVSPSDPIDIAARKLEQYNISALPVVDAKRKVIGIITSEDLSKLLAGGT